MSSFAPFPKTEIEQTLSKRFEAQVSLQGDRLAVRAGKEDWSYHRLNQYANHIAMRLLTEGQDAGFPVAILCDQGVEFIAATLGILKAGYVYSPLDPLESRANREARIKKLGPRIILTDGNHYQPARDMALPDLKVIDIETLDYSTTLANPGNTVRPGDLAYVYLSSGSTGEPKGVMDTHRNALHNIMRYTNSLKISPEDRLTLLHTPNFSACVSSQFGALLNGASVFPNQVLPESVHALPDWLVSSGITIYHSVPRLLRYALSKTTIHSSLRMIRLEGDAASLDELRIFNAFSPPSCRLVNGLGASETGITRQYFYQRNAPLSQSPVPVGYAVEDMEVTVLNEKGDRTLPGQEGEVIVSSRYLSPGYWKDPERTARVFEEDPDHEGQRTWRSGDIGVLHQDGCLEIRGRVDSVTEDTAVPFLEPATPTEKALAGIWSAILDHKPIGRDDDFLRLGGDSLLSFRMESEIKSHFGVPVSSMEIFQYTSLRDLAQLLENKLNQLPG